MKKISKILLLITMLFLTLVAMSAELVAVERHTSNIQLQQSFDEVNLDLNEVQLTAFSRTLKIVPINEEEVEISYGLINSLDRIYTIKVTIEKTTFKDLQVDNNPLDKEGESLQVNDTKRTYVEIRIRGVPTQNDKRT